MRLNPKEKSGIKVYYMHQRGSREKASTDSTSGSKKHTSFSHCHHDSF